MDSVEASLGRDIKYTYKTYQYCIWSHEAKQPFFYDACCREKMKIIEFNGDYWHANPRHYAAGDIVSKRLNTTAWDIWEKDRIKRETAIRAGFDVMVVWECDYRENPDVSHVARWISE